MDWRKGPRQHFRGGYKSSSVQQNGRNGCETTPKYGFYKSSRPQKNSYKMRGNYPYPRNFQPNYSQNIGSRGKPLIKSNMVPEDLEEEERKRKLSDTANKLLSKLKTWNAESKSNQDFNKLSDSSQTSVNCDLSSNSIEQLAREPSTRGTNSSQVGSLVNSEGKTKRIAHSKTKNNSIGVKKTVHKSSQSCRNPIRTRRYDVNKATVKDFQNRIQHKLINDIMQMPKESLQNVLNDPKINPIMELKMSHLVRENKLLIAQKLRALAESKMTSNDSSTNSLLLVDIDKLIDPVIETDLSVLPYELIKQMENIFQVEFDYTNIRSSCEGEPQSIETSSSNTLNNCALSDDTCQMPSENVETFEDNQTNLNLFGEVPLQTVLSNKDVGLKISAETNPVVASVQSLSVNTVEGNQKTDNFSNEFTNEDPKVYECSTDEDEDIEEISFPILKGQNQEENSSNGVCYNTIKLETDNEIPEGNIISNKSKRKSSLAQENFSKRRKRNKVPNTHLVVSNSKPINSAVIGQNSNGCLFEDGKQLLSLFSSQSKYPSTGCQTLCESKNVGVQTSNDESSSLYGVPLPRLARDDNSDSLLEEVTLIQNLINKLNERRFMIFLQLAKSNPSGSFISDKITADNFTETLSNGNINLVESLKNFFTQTASKNRVQTLSDDLKPKAKKKKRKSPNEYGNGD